MLLLLFVDSLKFLRLQDDLSTFSLPSTTPDAFRGLVTPRPAERPGAECKAVCPARSRALARVKAWIGDWRSDDTRPKVKTEHDLES